MVSHDRDYPDSATLGSRFSEWWLWRILSFGTCRRADQSTDDSEERPAYLRGSLRHVKEATIQEQTIRWSSRCLLILSSTLKMEEVHIPPHRPRLPDGMSQKDRNLHSATVCRRINYVSLRFYIHGYRDSDWLRAWRPRGQSSSPGRVKNFPFFMSSHPASYPMGTGGYFPGGKAAGGVKLTTHLHLVPRSRKHGAIHPLPHKSSCRTA
jgi:hypothetical protein